MMAIIKVNPAGIRWPQRQCSAVLPPARSKAEALAPEWLISRGYSIDMGSLVPGDSRDCAPTSAPCSTLRESGCRRKHPEQ
jgi:hypothetical protein